MVCVNVCLSVSLWVNEDASRTEEAEKTKPDVDPECVSNRSSAESSGRDQHTRTHFRDTETGASTAGNKHTHIHTLIPTLSFRSQCPESVQTECH